MNMKKTLLFSLLSFFAFSTFGQATFSTTGSGGCATCVWGDNTNWQIDSGTDDDGVPDSDDTVIINHDITVFSADRECASLTVNTDGSLDGYAQLTVRGGRTLTVSGSGTVVTLNGLLQLGYLDSKGKLIVSSGNMSVVGKLVVSKDGLASVANSSTITNSGTIAIESSSSSYGSIINRGTYTTSGSGTTTYARYINSQTNGWDLISSPLSNVDMASFISNNANLARQTVGDPGNETVWYAVGTYTNTSEAYGTGDPGEGWNNYNNGLNVPSGTFPVAKGYQMASDTGSTVTFSGGMLTSDQTIDVTNNEEGADDLDFSDGNRFSLIGNPFPAYINVTGFINSNSSNFHANNGGIYGWNGSGYNKYSLLNGGFIAPGQAFFVGTVGPDTSVSTMSFPTSIISSTANWADDFISGDTMPDENQADIILEFNQLDDVDSTHIGFTEVTADDFDFLYDLAVLGGFDSNNKIYSRIPSDDQGINLAIQALAYSEMWDKVIPLGINALGSEEMTISISHRTTPADLNIYLEDTEEGTMTNLLDGDFVLTPTSDLSGVGRFFIHMTADTMSSGEVSTSMLNAYKEIDASYITIEGLATQSNETKVSLYNILGREVLSTTLNNNMGTQTISTVGLSAGIYVIELESGSDRLTKKLLIQ